MRFLLDTQAFIWWDTKSAQLSPRARSLCDDSANTMVLSIASAWEMQIKIQIGKMQLAVPLATMIDDQRRSNGLELLPIALPHVLELSNLPSLSDHKDPFDRIIIAQAIVERIPLMSIDPVFSRYPVTVLW